MACRGVVFALDEKLRSGLYALAKDEDRIEYLDSEVLEPYWDESFAELLDKSWDGLHRSFSGAELPEDGTIGPPTLPNDPLRHALIGDESALQAEEDSSYIVRIVDPATVAQVATALTALTPEEFTARYHRYCKGAYPEYGDQDLEYSLEYLEILRDFYNKVASVGDRWVVFLVDL